MGLMQKIISSAIIKINHVNFTKQGFLKLFFIFETSLCDIKYILNFNFFATKEIL